MADRSYVQRSDISNQGQAIPITPLPAPVAAPVPVVPPATPYSTGRAFGGALTRAFGDALGNAVPQGLNAAAGFPAAALATMASSQPARVAARDFLDGATGAPAYNPNSPAPATKPAAKTTPSANPASAAIAATPAAPMLTHPLTLHEATALSGILGTLMPAPRPALPHEAVYAAAAQNAQSMFANAVAQAQDKAKTDPQGARADVGKAQDELLKRQLEILQVNPQSMAMAQILNPGGQ